MLYYVSEHGDEEQATYHSQVGHIRKGRRNLSREANPEKLADVIIPEKRKSQTEEEKLNSLSLCEGEREINLSM